MNYLLYASIIFLTHVLFNRYQRKISLSFGKLLGLTVILLLLSAVISTFIGTLQPVILSTLVTAVLLQNTYLRNTQTRNK